MKVTIPPKLQKWDEIRVIAPARSMSILSEEIVHEATVKLQKLWLIVSFWKNIYEQNEFNSSSIVARINDLHDAFSDPNVKGILTVIWWYNSNQLLPYINYNLIQNNPKILCGFSDITILSNALLARAWLVWYSGPHFSSWWIKYGFDYSMEYFIKCCMNSNPFFIESAKQWSDDSWYLNQENRIFEKNLWYMSINQWKASWRIIGGHIPCLSTLIWSIYAPVIDEDILLFIEQDEEFSIQIFDRLLQHILYSSYSKYIKWIVIGKFQKNSNIDYNLLSTIIKNKKELDHIPVIANANFGHTMPFCTFPIGWYAEISSWSTSYIHILEH